MANIIDMFSNIELNTRELIRRIIKIICLLLILYLSLTSTNRLDNTQILHILCVNIIMYCMIEMLFPSIKIEKTIENRNKTTEAP
jgi:hypothetical protein